MLTIRATFDGKTFVPDQAINLPASSTAIVLVNDGPAARAEFDRATREYYVSATSSDAHEDQSWGNGIERDAKRAWDED